MAPKPKIRHVDLVALGLTIMATIVQIVGFGIPNWWTFEYFDGRTLVIGILKSDGCDKFKRCDKTFIDVDNGTEWLFMTRIFELFGVILCLLSTIVHIAFLPTRNFNVRSVAIYALAAASIFILAGSIIFAVMHTKLVTTVNENKGQQTTGPGFGLCIFSGLLAMAAAIVTGAVTVRKGEDYYIINAV
ncbi:unnamed protein product [Mytilus coruscus]|uniref:Uncharacterized protein n=1 Tax=Mytilus coruscus TaxID=42192 RepID=A0A6J8E996_MYTCO|nr:unnamed protein product [Mytilus coruscus]